MLSPRTPRSRFEGDPSTFTVDKLELLSDLGCTKLSCGVQSFDDPVLRHCGRQHTAVSMANAVAECLGIDTHVKGQGRGCDGMSWSRMPLDAGPGACWQFGNRDLDPIGQHRTAWPMLDTVGSDLGTRWTPRPLLVMKRLSVRFR